MKTCPNCGNQCQEQAAFCVNCGYAFPKNTPMMEMNTEATAPVGMPGAVPAGTPAQEGPADMGGAAPMGTPVQELYTPAAPPKKKKKGLIIALASVAVIALAVGLFFLIRGMIARANPDGETFLEIQRSYFAERFDAEKEAERLGARDNLSMDVSLSAEISGNQQEVQQIGNLLDGSAIVFKADSVPGRFLFNLVINLKGSNILEGIFTMTEQEIGLSVPALDERYFVLDLEKTGDMLGIDLSSVSGLLGASTRKLSADDLKTLGATLRGILSDNISNASLTTEEVQGARLEGLGLTLDGRLTTWKPSAEELVALQNDFAAFLESDETLHRLLEENFGYFVSGTGNDIQSQLKTNAENIRANAQKNAEQFVTNGFAWSVLTDGDGRIARIAMDAGAQNGPVSFSYETRTEGNKTDEALLMTENGVRRFAILHQFTEEDHIRKGDIDLSTPMGAVLIRYETDRSERSAFGGYYGSWEIDLGNLLSGVKPRIDITKDSSYDSCLTISVDGLGSYTGGALESAKLMLRAKEGSTAKEPEGTRTDITEYTAEQMEDIVRKMGNQLLYTLLTSPEIMDILGSFF